LAQRSGIFACGLARGETGGNIVGDFWGWVSGVVGEKACKTVLELVGGGGRVSYLKS